MGYLETQQASKDLLLSIHEFLIWIHDESLKKSPADCQSAEDHCRSFRSSHFCPFLVSKILVWFQKAAILIDQMFVFVSTFPSEQPPGYDQLEGIRRSRPAFHHNLLRALLLQLADACGCFFRGCPVPWVLAGKHLG